MGSPAPSGPRRRRRRKGTPRAVLLVAAVCVLAILVIPATRYFGPMVSRPKPTSAAPVRQYQLVLSEAALAGEGGARHIAGAVRNNSSSPYEDVEVWFTVRDRRMAGIGTIAAKVKSVAPKSTAAFKSEPVPAGAFRIALREITGTQR